jgi:hypothetical protein
MKTPTRVLLLAVISFLFLRTPASANPIVYAVANGSATTPDLECLGSSCVYQVLMASWTSSFSFTNVSISAEVSGDPGSTITAYLTTQVGTGTTVADQIASAILTPPTTDTAGVLLLSNLTLGPGTYYLVLSGPTTGSAESYWYAYSTPTVTLAPGVFAGTTGEANLLDSNSSPNISYAPASVFDTGPSLSIQVTGTQVVSAPEPRSGYQLAIGVGLLGCLVFRRRRRSRAV